MRNELLHEQSIKKPVQIFYCDIYRVALLRKCRPTKSTTLPAFVVKGKSVLVPMQNFDLVLVLVTENEKGALKRIQFKGSLYYGCQAIDRLSHINMSAGKIDNGLGRESTYCHNAFSILRTSNTCFGLQPF